MNRKTTLMDSNGTIRVMMDEKEGMTSIAVFDERGHVASIVDNKHEAPKQAPKTDPKQDAKSKPL